MIMIIVFLVLDSSFEALRGALHLLLQNVEVLERWHVLLLFIT